MGVASLLRVLPTAALAASALRGHDLLGGGAGAGDALAADAGAAARPDGPGHPGSGRRDFPAETTAHA